MIRFDETQEMQIISADAQATQPVPVVKDMPESFGVDGDNLVNTIAMWCGIFGLAVVVSIITWVLWNL